VKWQKSLNLVSDSTLKDYWNRHVLDSMQLLPYVNGSTILDIGSGAGFPGMVLAIAGNFDVTCVDSDKRKMLFLSEVSRITRTRVNIASERIENLQKTTFDTVCARGFSDLSKLLDITIKNSASGYGVFLKGAKLNEEILKANKSFCYKYCVYPSKTSVDGSILVVNSVCKRKQ
jgi:16S rRNA (guanine527-N7)-methyltransferase